MVTALSCQIKMETRFKSYLFKTTQHRQNISVGNYIAQQDFRWVPQVYMYNNSIGSVVRLVMCMI